MYRCDNCENKFIKPNKTALHLNMRRVVYCVCTECGSRYIHEVPDKYQKTLDWMRKRWLMK